MFLVSMLVLMLFSQLMLWGQARNAADAAAEEGAEAAAEAGGNSEVAIAAASGFASVTGVRDVEVSVASDGNVVTVTVRGVATQVFPAGSWTVSATASAPIEVITR